MKEPTHTVMQENKAVRIAIANDRLLLNVKLNILLKMELNCMYSKNFGMVGQKKT